IAVDFHSPGEQWQSFIEFVLADQAMPLEEQRKGKEYLLSPATWIEPENLLKMVNSVIQFAKTDPHNANLQTQPTLEFEQSRILGECQVTRQGLFEVAIELLVDS